MKSSVPATCPRDLVGENLASSSTTRRSVPSLRTRKQAVACPPPLPPPPSPPPPNPSRGSGHAHHARFDHVAGCASGWFSSRPKLIHSTPRLDDVLGAPSVSRKYPLALHAPTSPSTQPTLSTSKVREIIVVARRDPRPSTSTSPTASLVPRQRLDPGRRRSSSHTARMRPAVALPAPSRRRRPDPPMTMPHSRRSSAVNRRDAAVAESSSQDETAW